MGERQQAEEARRRAELFDALSHGTRIRILKALEVQPLTFAELKKALGIESSGHLQHHLAKLGILVKQMDGAKYALSDDGKEALRVFEAVRLEGIALREAPEEESERKWWEQEILRPFRLSFRSLAMLALPMLIIAILYFSGVTPTSLSLIMLGSWSFFGIAYFLGTLIEQYNLRRRAIVSFAFLSLSVWLMLYAFGEIESKKTPLLAAALMLLWVPLYLQVAFNLIRAYEGKK